MSGSPAAVFEEAAEQSGGFDFEETALCGEGVIKAAVGGDVMEGAGVAGLGVWCGVDEAREPGGVGSAGAHWARFEGGVEGAAGQAPATQGSGCIPDGEEFRVGRRVTGGLALVGGDGQDLRPPRDHRSDGDLAPLGRALRGQQGTAHHGEIRIRGGGQRLPEGDCVVLLAHASDDNRAANVEIPAGL